LLPRCLACQLEAPHNKPLLPTIVASLHLCCQCRNQHQRVVATEPLPPLLMLVLVLLLPVPVVALLLLQHKWQSLQVVCLVLVLVLPEEEKTGFVWAFPMDWCGAAFASGRFSAWLITRGMRLCRRYIKRVPIPGRTYRDPACNISCRTEMQLPSAVSSDRRPSQTL